MEAASLPPSSRLDRIGSIAALALFFSAPAALRTGVYTENLVRIDEVTESH
jgi:hypothetical protein